MCVCVWVEHKYTAPTRTWRQSGGKRWVVSAVLGEPSQRRVGSFDLLSEIHHCLLVASVLLLNFIQIEVKMLLLLPMQSLYSQWISLIGFNWTTWFVLASCAVLAWICWRNSRYVRLINAVPGPKGIPILGNLLELNVGQVGNRIIVSSSLYVWMDNTFLIRLNFNCQQNSWGSSIVNGWKNTDPFTAVGEALVPSFASPLRSWWRLVCCFGFSKY